MSSDNSSSPVSQGQIHLIAGSSSLRYILVLCADSYIARTGRFIACAVVEESAGYPFEVELAQTERGSFFALADQIATLDARALGLSSLSLVGTVDAPTLAAIAGKLNALLGSRAS